MSDELAFSIKLALFLKGSPDVDHRNSQYRGTENAARLA